MLWIGLISFYVAIGLMVGAVTFGICNPYGHISRLEQSAQALLAGAFWLPFMLYFAGVLLYEFWQGR